MPEKYNRRFAEMPPEIIKKLLHLPKEDAMKLFQRINQRLHLEKGNILCQAFDRNIFTKPEYDERYRDMFYDDYGSDSFLQYIDTVMNSDADCFITENQRMLRRKAELEERFGMRIASPKEILDEMEKEGKKK